MTLRSAVLSSTLDARDTVPEQENVFSEDPGVIVFCVAFRKRKKTSTVYYYVFNVNVLRLISVHTSGGKFSFRSIVINVYIDCTSIHTRVGTCAFFFLNINKSWFFAKDRDLFTCEKSIFIILCFSLKRMKSTVFKLHMIKGILRA